jgi:hypothetical protein
MTAGNFNVDDVASSPQSNSAIPRASQSVRTPGIDPITTMDRINGRRALARRSDRRP